MRTAVIFKAYAWDAFVQRQAERCARAAEGVGDFFVSVDETNGACPETGFARVVRTSNAALIASGLPDRFEAGSLIWWNPDYVHYDFRNRFPEYDQYIFVEYDALAQEGALARLSEAAATHALDMIALPLAGTGRYWWWTLPLRQTYPRREIEGTLICIALFSARALDMLQARRRAMAHDPAVRYWPSAEGFIGTEIRRAGLRHASIADFVDTSRYGAFPPMLEEDAADPAGPALFHPVLDKQRLIGSLLKSTVDVRDLWLPTSQTRRLLARFPTEDWRPMLLDASRKRVAVKMRERWERLRLRLKPGALLA